MTSSDADRRFSIFPYLGVISISVGLLAALLSRPYRESPDDSLVLSGSLLSLGILAAPIVAFIRSPHSILRTESLLALATFYWLLFDLVQNSYSTDGVSPWALQWGLMMVALFSSGVWIGALLRPWRLPSLISTSASYGLRAEVIFRLILFFFTLGILRFAIAAQFNLAEMVNGLLVNRWSAPWSRSALGDWDSFTDHLAYFGYLLPVLTVSFIGMSRLLSARSIVSIGLSGIMMAFLMQSGGRRVVGVMLGSAILCWLLRQTKIGIRTLFYAGIAVFFVLLTMEMMLQYRNEGWGALGSDEALESQQAEAARIHVDDNFLRLAQIVEIVPEQHPYVYHKQIFYTLIRPIPRVFWPGKPIDPGFDLTAAIGGQGASLSSSVIGELYVSGGWLVVLFGGVFYGKLARMLSVLLEKPTASSALVYSLASMTLFAGMRSMLDLVLMSYALLAWVAVSRFLLSVPRIMAWGRRLSIGLDSVSNLR